MAKGTYTYDPGNVKELGKDRMRFELGDVMVEGCSDTTALTDEEIQAAIETYPNHGKDKAYVVGKSVQALFL